MAAATVDPNERDAGVVDEIVTCVTSTPPKSFFLFAGAGSGKTRTLVAVLRQLTGIGLATEQVQGLPEADGPNQQFARELRARAQTIRVITYTKNAALVVTGRLGNNDLTQVATIHSFCWELIAGFDDDIREALLALNASDLQQARDAACNRRSGASERHTRMIAEYEGNEAALSATPHFSYSPDRKRHGAGALSHAQVLRVTAWLLKQKPTLRRILRDQHPVILIDESQDTMKAILDALLEVVAEDPSRLMMMGLLGDHRQRIYTDGHSDLPSIVPSHWATPKLEMNHRSQRRIVDLINEIWDSDLEGRTQSREAVRQHPRAEKSSGVVRLFIGNTKVKPHEKLRREALCESAMAEVTGRAEWAPVNGGHKVLALEHRLVARRGDFLNVYDALSLIDPDSVRPDVTGETPGPAEVQVLLREMIDLAHCVNGGQPSSDFAVTEVLHRYGRLLDLPADCDARTQQLESYRSAVKDFAAACSNPAATVREALDPIVQSGLFEPDKRLLAAFSNTCPPPDAPAPGKRESPENRLTRGWHAFFASPWIEVGRFKNYLSGKSHLATHQVVKGSEFEHVMVVMDDEDAGGFLFAYDRLFGAPLGNTDRKNAEANRETSIDRTLRLLYVTCSRAKESLALVLWACDAERALAYARNSTWFSDGEVQPIPE